MSQLSNGVALLSLAGVLTVFGQTSLSAQSYISGRITFDSVPNISAVTVTIPPLTFVLIPSDGTSTLTRTASLDASGNYLLTDLPSKKFNVWVKGDRWLSTLVGANTLSGDFVGADTSLRAGDVTGNNIIDVDDLSALLASYNSAKGDGIYELNPTADLNLNGLIDVDDLSRLLGNYNTQGAAQTAPADVAAYRVNCGSTGAVSNFAADGFVVGGSSVTTNTPNLTNVTDPAPANVYKSARTGISFTYTFPNLTPNTFYLLRLHYADFVSTATGQRLFKVTVQGQQLGGNSDPFAIAGNAAYVDEITSQADNTGKIIVAFSAIGTSTALCNGIEIISVPPSPPTGLEAQATGSGKISLFWQAMPGATSYNVYRSTTEGGQNYSAPVNSSPVNTLTYPGSRYCIFTDTGRTNGTLYYYIVRAVYPAGVSGPSTEDSEVAQIDGIPWDTRNAGAILSSFRAAFYDDEPDLGYLKVMAPDNTI